MTREQRLVTLAFLALAVVVVLALAGRVTATPPTHLGHISERMFSDVTVPAPLGAADTRTVDPVGAVRDPGRLLRGVPGRSDAPPSAFAPSLPTRTPGPRATDAAVKGPAQTPRTAPTSTPAATPPSSAISRGQATWYDDGPGYYAAVGSWSWGDDPYHVAVCTAIGGTSRCVTATVRDFCQACADGIRLIDLSPMAFRQLAPLSAGVVRVTVEGMR